MTAILAKQSYTVINDTKALLKAVKTAKRIYCMTVFYEAVKINKRDARVICDRPLICDDHGRPVVPVTGIYFHFNDSLNLTANPA